jgi:hypothetical protein
MAKVKLTDARVQVIVAAVGLVGVIGAALIGYRATVSSAPSSNPPLSQHPASSQVELVDVSASARRGESVVLDVKLRNIGEKTSILKRAIARVRNWRILSTCSIGAGLPVSSTYQLTLPTEPTHSQFNASVELSDFLKPNEASRIQLVTGLNEERPFIDGILFQLQLELQFDADQFVISKPLLISLPGKLSTRDTWNSFDSGAGDSFEQECAKENITKLDFMLGLPGGRSADIEQLTGT